MKLCLRLLVLVLICSTTIPAIAQSKKSAKKKPAEAAADKTPGWIWLGKKPADKQVVFFRKEFTTKRGRLTGARLFAACDDRMTVFVNGKRVIQRAGWEKPTFANVADQMQRGRNVITVRGQNSVGPAGLLVKLELESSGLDPYSIVTDETWQVSQKIAEGWQAANFNAKSWKKATVIALLGQGPWTAINAATLTAGVTLREPTATPINQMKVHKDFAAELLYSVPKNEQGSWVNMCVDPKGRLIVSDQYGGLYRVTPPPLGGEPGQIKIEKINVDIGEAQGLLWAHDGLYVVVNKGGQFESGLYRVTDSDGDDQLDKLDTLRKLTTGGGEHGPHAVLPAPDGKSLYVVCGNQAKLTDISGSLVPRAWDEDQLLPRIYGRGFMRGVPAPGGCIYRVSPDGKKWELVANGFRNEFDAAVNRFGDLFSYDADMEWDMNTPWYRPTRVCHVVSGAEFGWRNGSGKFPAYTPDSVPAVVNIGPGSPTGIVFGYGAKFPAKYQESLFICDWSYGKLYAVHMTAKGATYTGMAEEFVTGTPLPLTDVVINPHDGAMYFTIGGRRTKSGLYRVTYTGKESTAAINAKRDDRTADAQSAHKLRKKLESFHGRKDPRAVQTAWASLGSSDRAIRFAARVALEHQDPKIWQERAVNERDTQKLLTVALSVARVGDKSLQPQLLKALGRLQWSELTHDQQVGLLRAYTLAFTRMGAPNDATKKTVIAKLNPHYPADSRVLNGELCNMLVYLQAPETAAKSIELLANAPTQEEQMQYAKSLRLLETGWTMALREEYFSWFVKAANYKGGASFSKFVEYIKKDAVAKLSDAEKLALKPILEAKPKLRQTIVAVKQRPFVKKWSMDDLAPLVQKPMTGRDFDQGRKLFGQAACFACHRFDNEGGAIGPDLTALSGRFSPRDMLESLLEPSKVISDQYSAVTIVTDDGKVVTGRIVNLAGDSYKINTDMLNPDALTSIDRKQIAEMLPSKVSMMPEGLLNTLKRDEILDLMAYLLSLGDRKNKMFKKK